LLLLAMLRLLDGSASVRHERAVSADANVAPEAVNTGGRTILVADFEVRSEDSASALHHGLTVFRGSRSESSTLILSALNAIWEGEISHGRIDGNAGVSLPRLLILNQA
jgi:hypothetical protein